LPGCILSPEHRAQENWAEQNGTRNPDPQKRIENTPDQRNPDQTKPN